MAKILLVSFVLRIKLIIMVSDSMVVLKNIETVVKLDTNVFLGFKT